MVAEAALMQEGKTEGVEAGGGNGSMSGKGVPLGHRRVGGGRNRRRHQHARRSRCPGAGDCREGRKRGVGVVIRENKHNTNVRRSSSRIIKFDQRSTTNLTKTIVPTSYLK